MSLEYYKAVLLAGLSIRLATCLEHANSFFSLVRDNVVDKKHKTMNRNADTAHRQCKAGNGAVQGSLTLAKTEMRSTQL